MSLAATPFSMSLGHGAPRGVAGAGVLGVLGCSTVLFGGFYLLHMSKKPLYSSQPSASVCSTPGVVHPPHGLCTHPMGFAPTLWVIHPPQGLCTNPTGCAPILMGYAPIIWNMQPPHGLCTHPDGLCTNSMCYAPT